MRGRIGLIAGLLSCLLGGAAPSAFAQSASERSPVVITLQPEASVDDTTVYLGHFAKITGASAALQRRLAYLDVADFRVSADSMHVSADQVKFRLLLAGFDASQFRLTGAKRTVILESDEPIALRKVLHSAENALRLHAPDGAFKGPLVPAQPVACPEISVRANDRIQYTTKLIHDASQTGVVRADVSIVVNGRTREVVPVHLEMPASAKATDSRVVQAGAKTNPNEFIIRQRDTVKMVVPVGNVRIEATGEALQDGKVGDLIRVRNLASLIVVVGRVEARGLVIASD